ncbi:hypothetical protein D3C76_841670 [compost metagenome]
MGQAHTDQQRYGMTGQGFIQRAGLAVLGVLAFQAHLEPRAGGDVERLVAQQTRRLAPLGEPGLPATLGDQLHAIAAGGSFDLKGMPNIQGEIERQLGVIWNHDIAHIKILVRTDRIGNRAPVLT